MAEADRENIESLVTSIIQRVNRIGHGESNVVTERGQPETVPVEKEKANAMDIGDAVHLTKGVDDAVRESGIPMCWLILGTRMRQLLRLLQQRVGAVKGRTRSSSQDHHLSLVYLRLLRIWQKKGRLKTQWLEKKGKTRR